MINTNKISKSCLEEVYDLVIVGGGLAGLSAAATISNYKDLKVLLIDSPAVNGAEGFGGFAKFSGAKFSPPPAGRNLRSLVETDVEFIKAVNYFGNISGLSEKLKFENSSVGYPDFRIANSELSLRKYNSVILSPKEMDVAISEIWSNIGESVDKINVKCESISRNNEGFFVNIEGSSPILAKSVFISTGRSATQNLLQNVANETFSRGIDLGVRFEFKNKENVVALRSLGADAKILWKNCRTFCLNYPGEVFRYSFGPISIPGGVVAEKNALAANFGILFRADNKKEILSNLVKKYQQQGSDINLSIEVENSIFGKAEQKLKSIFPDSIVNELREFCELLSEAELVDWKKPHIVHMPLIDWHWPIYGIPGSSRSATKNLWVVGDSAGHARGLLQAGISGILGIKEFVSKNGYATST